MANSETMVVTLNIKNFTQYQVYRQKIEHLWKKYKGGVTHEYKLAEVVNSPVSAINHNYMVVVKFDDAPSREGFFSDPEYQKIKKLYFDSSVVETKVVEQFSQ